MCPTIAGTAGREGPAHGGRGDDDRDAGVILRFPGFFSAVRSLASIWMGIGGDQARPIGLSRLKGGLKGRWGQTF